MSHITRNEEFKTGPEYLRGKADFAAGVPQYEHSPYNHITQPLEYMYWYLGWTTAKREQDESR